MAHAGKEYATIVEATTKSYPFPVPSANESPREVLTEILRDGARKMLAEVIDDEVRVCLSQRRELVGQDGHQQAVRNGYLPERSILTGLGAI